jgi:hypothetical protein
MAELGSFVENGGRGAWELILNAKKAKMERGRALGLGEDWGMGRPDTIASSLVFPVVQRAPGTLRAIDYFRYLFGFVKSRIMNFGIIFIAEVSEKRGGISHPAGVPTSMRHR